MIKMIIVSNPMLRFDLYLLKVSAERPKLSEVFNVLAMYSEVPSSTLRKKSGKFMELN